MFDNPTMREFTSKHILHDRLREAEQQRLLKRAEAARRPVQRRGLLAVIRQVLAARRTFERPTTAAG